MEDRKKLIEESKKRCRRFSLNPEKKRLEKTLSEKEFLKRQKVNQLLINAALPYMSIITEIFKECGSVLALTDKEGYLLKLTGTIAALESRRELGLIEGASLREKDTGTTAVSIALRYRIPFFMSGREYFLKIFQKGACFAAPIFEEEKLLGAIIVVYPQKSPHPHSFALAQTLARLISREFKELTQENFIISLCNSLKTAVVVTGLDGFVNYSNPPAQNLLRVKNGARIAHDFSVNIFTPKGITNEIIYAKKIRQHLVAFRKEYNNKFLFLFEPIEDSLKREGIKGKAASYTFDDIVGLKNIKKRARHLAMQNVNILISGESGTGKELFASATHNASARAHNRFVVVNCGAIPETLFEAELFGYKKGAFTDARIDHLGKIEYADGGTLFLDEVGDLPFEVQGKLLRVLEDKKVNPLGGNEFKKVNVRFIFATNRNLEALVKQKKFREDLYYRINSPTIKIPPLRERKDEILDLIHHFLGKLQHTHKRFVAGINEEAISRLIVHDFPGNVRELEGILRNAYLTCSGEVIDVDDLGITVKSARTLKERINEYRRNLITEKICENNGDLRGTAQGLGISVRSIYRYAKIKKYKAELDDN